jgi:dTDP-glucose 4,6-dehydratase
MRNFLITGGAGFIGSHFIEMLLNQEQDVIVYNLDKLTYAGKLENMPFLYDERHVFIHGDICDQLLVSELFKKHNFDVVVNFAAESHVDNSINDPSVFIHTNIIGTATLLNNAKNFWLNMFHKRFIQISTDEVYGSLGTNGVFTEESQIKPNSPYSSSKAAADLLAMSYFKTYGLPVVITRCSNNYGPRQDSEKLIPKVIQNVLNNKKIPVYGDGLNIRDWIYVRDHCNAILSLINYAMPGNVFNVGGSNEKKNLEIINFIESKLNIGKSLVQFIPDRLGHDFRYAIDDTKLISLIGSYRGTSFQEGIENTIEYYKGKLDE